MAILRYGNNSCVQIELADRVSPGESGVPRGQPLADTAAATTAALAEPLDYPTLARSTTPVDRVVLALDRGVPQVAQRHGRVVRRSGRRRHRSRRRTVLASPADCDARGRRSLPAASLRRCGTDHPADPRPGRPPAVGLSGGQRVGRGDSVNRALHKADVVLPVGCLRGDRAAGYFGIHSASYPAFSDAKTRSSGFAGFRHSLNGRGEPAARTGGRRGPRRLAAWASTSPSNSFRPAADKCCTCWPARAIPCGGGGRNSIAPPGTGPPARGPAWSWPPIEGGAGQTDVGERGPGASRRPAALSRRTARSPSVATWPRRPGPAMQRLAQRPSREAALRQVGPAPAGRRPARRPDSRRALDRNKVYLLEPTRPGGGRGLGNDSGGGAGGVGPARPAALVVRPAFQCPCT